MRALVVSRAEAGQKMLNFLERRVHGLPGEFHRWIRSGQVRLNGGRVKAFDRVSEGDAVRVPPFAVLRLVDDAHQIPDTSFPGTVHEDDDMLIIDKPAGLPTQGGTGHDDSAAARLTRLYAHADFIPAPAHRLDKDTSGLLIIGKTYAALRGLTDALARRDGEAPRKEYFAWTWGRWPGQAVRELRDTLVKDKLTQRMITQEQDVEKDHNALSLVLPVTTIEIQNQPATLMLVRLLTGRTHQIRVQLASRGFPLVGDSKYGDREKDAAAHNPPLKLHACRLTLPQCNPHIFTSLPAWPPPWRITALPEFPINEQAGLS